MFVFCKHVMLNFDTRVSGQMLGCVLLYTNINTA